MPDFIRNGHVNGMRISIFPVHEVWSDVGRPEELEKADQYLTHREA